MAHTDPPTPAQQRYLRTLAQRTGTSFTPSATSGEASLEIKRLKGLGKSPRDERDADRRAIAQTMRGGDVRVRDDEIEGYGSSCQWSHSTRASESA